MNAYVLSSLQKAPVVAERILKRIEPSRFDERSDPDRFTIREAISHLADWEPIWLERFEIGMKTPGATIQAYDEGQLAIDRKYAERDVFSEATRYIEGRKVLLDTFAAFTPEDWEKTIHHPERGVLTLGNFGCMILGHDVYHLEHFTQFLAEL